MSRSHQMERDGWELLSPSSPARYSGFKEPKEMCPLQPMVLGELGLLTSCGKCKGDG